MNDNGDREREVEALRDAWTCAELTRMALEGRLKGLKAQPPRLAIPVSLFLNYRTELYSEPWAWKGVKFRKLEDVFDLPRQQRDDSYIAEIRTEKHKREMERAGLVSRNLRKAKIGANTLAVDMGPQKGNA